MGGTFSKQKLSSSPAFGDYISVRKMNSVLALAGGGVMEGRILLVFLWV